MLEQRLQKALEKIAAYIADGDEALLPIFERLEAELEAAQRKASAMNRARALALQNDIGPNRRAA